jgi:PAP2 superfamily protein
MLKLRSSAITRTHALWIVQQAGLVLLAVFVYFGVRGLTAGSYDVALSHSREIVDLEKRLGINVEGSLQAPVVRSETLEMVANWVYIWGHWPVIVVTMLWLARRHRDIFLRLRNAMVISGAFGIVIFVAYPVAPPRLAHLGLEDTVSERSHAYRVLQPPAFVNQYAAMPSLHVGWDLLVGISIVSATSVLALRIIGCVMPVLMALAVVVTANHYILDAVVGVVIVLLAHVCALALERHRYQRRRGGPAVPHPTVDETAPTRASRT